MACIAVGRNKKLALAAMQRKWPKWFQPFDPSIARSRIDFEEGIRPQLRHWYAVGPAHESGAHGLPAGWSGNFCQDAPAAR